MVRAGRAVLPDGERAADIGIRDGTIAAVAPAGLPGRVLVELADDEVLLPGLVDSHVHVNDPGRTEWEGFATATAAAAAGGVTTIVDMPLNSVPPTVSVAALATKRAVAGPLAHVDVGFWGGAVPGNAAELRALHDAGVFGFKCFLLPSGVPEFGHLDAGELEEAMTTIAGFDGLLIVHAEDAGVIDAAPAPHGPGYAGFVASRPVAAELRAIDAVIAAARRTGCRVHLLHLSGASAIPRIGAARADGLRLTVETCPHYLALDSADVPDGATAYKCCPPIRDSANRDALWQGLADGLIDLIVTDHSPATVALKEPASGDFGEAWGGISSLELGLSVVWTQARRRGLRLADVVRWMCAGPARQTGLRRKGALVVGADADFCVFAPDESFTVEARTLRHRNPVTPYDGHELTGRVRRTWLRGVAVDLDGPPRGRLLTRPA